MKYTKIKAFVIFILKEKYILSLYNHQYILNDIHKLLKVKKKKTKKYHCTPQLIEMEV